MSVSRINNHMTPVGRIYRNNLNGHADLFVEQLSALTRDQFNTQKDTKDNGTKKTDGIRASYSADSTADEPIVVVESDNPNIDLIRFIRINSVNPDDATQIEMFALCCYADDIGEGSGNDNGSYATLRLMANGSFIITDETKHNWKQMAEGALSMYQKSGSFLICSEGQKLLNFMRRYPKL